MMILVITGRVTIMIIMLIIMMIGKVIILMKK